MTKPTVKTQYRFNANPSIPLLAAMVNKTGFGLLLSTETIEFPHEDGFCQVSDFDISDFKLPLATVDKMVKKYGDNLAFDELYDNQDEFGAPMPGELMFELTDKDVQALKSNIKDVLGLALNIHSQDDLVAFYQRITQAKTDFLRLGDMSFELVNSGFDVVSEDEQGQHVDIVDFRYRTKAKLVISTRPSYLSDEFQTQDFNAHIDLIMYARDFNGECYAEIGVQLSDLLKAVLA